MSDVDIIEEMRKTGSQKRYRPETPASNDTQQPIRVARASANRTAEQPLVVRTANPRRTADYGGEPRTNAPRAAQQPQQSRRTTQAYQEQHPLADADTDADVEIAQTMRPRSAYPAPPTRQLPPLHQGPYAQGHTKAITLGVGATIAVMWLAWFFSTSGASFWATHVTDPSTYGPMHGNVVTGIFGGGDSGDHPSKLIALNNGGHVEIIKLTAGDPTKTQIIVGPDLVAISFPDPTQAEVELRVDGPDVTVTIYGSGFELPFHRYSQFIVLHSDGKGNLKPKTGGQ